MRVERLFGLCIVAAGFGCSFDSSPGGNIELEGSTSSGGPVMTTETSPGSTDAPDTEDPPATVSTTSATEDTMGETTTSSGSSSSEDSSSGASEAESSSSSGGASFELCDESDPELRACYDFDGVGGGVLTDLSMFENHGEAEAVGVEPGPFGDAARPGVDASLSVPDSSSLDVEGPAAFEAWVFFDSLPELGRAGVLDNEGQYSMIYFSGQGMRCLGAGASAFAAVPQGEWVHIACNFSGGEMSIWVNGELEDSSMGMAAILTGNTQPLSIGDTSPGFNEPMDGLVGGVRVWSVARTPEQLADAAAALE